MAGYNNNNEGFWKPSSASSTTDEGDVAPVFNFSTAPLAQQRMLLPIYKHKRQILYSVEKFGVTVIVGETACGKSTQIPMFLYHNGWCNNGFQIVCTQPRRIAAQTLAARVAKEVGRGPLGAEVGYTVRFADRTSELTKIIYATDGILLREATLADPLLSRYSIVIVDEAHERNLNTDALCGLLKKIRRKRPDLRIVVCSATIDAEAFLDFFISKKDVEHTRKQKKRRRWDNAEPDTQPKLSTNNLNEGCIISVDGRLHEVDVLYLGHPTSNYVRTSVETALQICKTSRNNRGCGILCFLPSASEVDEAIRMTQDHLDEFEPGLANQIIILPLYAQLPFNMQARVFRSDTPGSSRIIYSTNISETSVTVPGITHVIDSGMVKLPFFDPKNDFDRLIVVPISKASAKQRSGRAGRLQAGQCYRLYTEEYFRKKMEEATPPEILRTNLSNFILSLKALGVNNILGFDLLDLPSVDALSHGLESLFALGAIDDATALTTIGQDMSSFPTEPRISRMLLESLREECSREVAGVAGALQVQSLFLTPRGSSARRQQLQIDYEAAVGEFADNSGDHVTYANILQAYDDTHMGREECKEKYVDYVALQKVIEVRNQLLGFLKRFGRVRSLGMATSKERCDAILRCVTAGFFFNVAKLHNDGRYYTIRGTNQILVTPSSSSVFNTHGSHADYIVFCNTHDGSRGGIELTAVSAINPRWLRELAPHYWK
ncbi:ATP-dependent helicase HrpA [Nitzschia inconspicua]|uniref:RNA helicase n=1 Tax=Nitzschia inconspicua TaxID=303405 RepID=A0A9K3Q4X0_9STRA|nr:ATP-dependent helicase HrpA [Nitzschia inconspicua]